MTADLMTTLATDPVLRAALDALKPSIPVLVRIGTEAAVNVLRGLSGVDTMTALETLRRNATAAEWAAIKAELTSCGALAAIEAVQDRDFGLALVLSILLGLAQGIKV